MDELERLRHAHADVRAPDQPAVEAARRRLREAIAEAATPGPAPGAPRRRRGARRRGLRIAAATVACAAVLVVVSLWPGEGAGPAGPSAASAARLCGSSAPGPPGPCLDALGELAAADAVLGRGKVFYRRDRWSQSIMYVKPNGRPQSSPYGPGVYGIVRAGDQELWVAPDRSGRITYGSARRPYLPSAADRRAWRAAGSPDIDRLAGPADRRDELPPRTFAAGELDAVLLGGGGLDEALPRGDPLRDLPTDANALERELQRLSAKRGYGTNITMLLRYPFTSPRLRRTLLHLLGEIPGTRRLGAVRDPAGRRGAAILIPGDLNNGLNVVVFDLATGRLLAQGRAEDGTPDTLRWHDLYDLELGAVDRIGQRPG